jgi:hypothetical protein
VCSNARWASSSLCSRSSRRRRRYRRQQHTTATTMVMATTAATTPLTTAPFTRGSCTGGTGARTPIGAAGGGGGTQKRSIVPTSSILASTKQGQCGGWGGAGAPYPALSIGANLPQKFYNVKRRRKERFQILLQRPSYISPHSFIIQASFGQLFNLVF